MQDLSIEDILADSFSNTASQSSLSTASNKQVSQDPVESKQPKQPPLIFKSYEAQGISVAIQPHCLSPLQSTYKTTNNSSHLPKFTLSPDKHNSPQISQLLVKVKQHKQKQMDHFINKEGNFKNNGEEFQHTQAVSTFYKAKSKSNFERIHTSPMKSQYPREKPKKKHPLFISDTIRERLVMTDVIVRGRSLLNKPKGQTLSPEPALHSQNISSNNREYSLALQRRKQRLQTQQLRRASQIANNVKNSIQNHILFATSAKKQKTLSLKVKEQIKSDMKQRRLKERSNERKERLRVFSEQKQGKNGKSRLKIDTRGKENRSIQGVMGVQRSNKKAKLPTPQQNLLQL